MQKILILEDDRLLAKTLVGSLGGRHVVATAVHTLSAFHSYIERKKVDLCILDRMINGTDVLDAIGFLRDLHPKAKVLFLSKKAAVVDRIHGLEQGADDYLAKPFSLAELRLRVRKLLLVPAPPAQKQVVPLDALQFYPEQGLITTPQGTIVLRRREVEILNHLLEAKNSFVSREEMISRLWPAVFEPSNSTVDVYVRRLRQKLGEYKFLLETRRGFGYRLLVGSGKQGGYRRAPAWFRSDQ